MSKLIQQIEKELGVNIPPGKTSGRVKVRCPKCDTQRTDKKDKSLSIDLDAGFFRCQYAGCEWKGKVGYTKEEYKRPETTKLDISREVLTYLRDERKITEEAIRDLRVGSSIQWFGEQKRCINFNYFDHLNRHVNTKLRTRDKEMRFEVSGGKLCLYNESCLRAAVDAGWLIITEGEIDALTWYSAGFHFVVSVPNGASGNTEYLDDVMENYIMKIDTVYLSVDMDQSGDVLRKALINRIGEDKVRIIRLPKKDANEVMMDAGTFSDGVLTLNEAWESAEMPDMDGVFKLTSFEKEAREFFMNGWPDTYPIGINGMDHNKIKDAKGRTVLKYKGWLELPLGHLMAVSGTPNSGKSEWVDFLCAEVMQKHNWRVAKISTEEDKTFNVNKIIGKICQRPFTELEDEEWDFWFNYLDNKLYYTDIDSITIEDVIEKFTYNIRAYGTKMLVLDNFSSVDLSSAPGEMVHEKIAWALKTLQAFTRRYNVLLILVVHPKQLPDQSSGFYKLPIGYDLMGGSPWFNFIDIGMSVGWREEGVTDVKIWKIRYIQFVGKKGIFKLAFDIDKGGIYHQMQVNEKNEKNEIEEEDYEETPDSGQHEEDSLEAIFGVYKTEGQ